MLLACPNLKLVLGLGRANLVEFLALDVNRTRDRCAVMSVVDHALLLSRLLSGKQAPAQQKLCA
jgi:hypothetical protein